MKQETHQHGPGLLEMIPKMSPLQVPKARLVATEAMRLAEDGACKLGLPGPHVVAEYDLRPKDSGTEYIKNRKIYAQTYVIYNYTMYCVCRYIYIYTYE